MDLTHSLVDSASRPKFLLEHDRIRSEYSPQSPYHLSGSIPWSLSPLNPKNRVDSLDVTRSRWRIDGATVCGTVFFAIPLDLLPDLPPLRIFVILPDQATFPPALRITLDAALSVPLRDATAIADLGISRHICRALDYHCTQDGFLRRYSRLPFASSIVFENVTANVKDMRLTFEPNYELEKKTVGLKVLQDLWPEVPSNGWPQALEVSQLRFVRQLHDTVSLVHAPGHDNIFVFKSAVGSIDHVYHELRFLLTVPSHPNIMPRPLAIITKRVAFGGKQGVVGFLLKHYPKGSIRDQLPALQRLGSLSHRLKLSWCRQVTVALIHIHEVAGTFYSDLRPDNVLLDDNYNIVLCDFEQRGNWHEWCAPEVLFRQYAENIRAALNTSASDTPFERLLTAYSNAFGSKTSVQSKNLPWFMLSAQAQDKAAVYTLGLFIFTVFEGLSNVRGSLMNKWPSDPETAFPTARLTPSVVMKLVRSCTDDAPEWTDVARPARPIRVGDILSLEGLAPLSNDSRRQTSIVLDGLVTWWSSEISRADAFIGSEEWHTRTFGQRRPSLQEVMSALNEVDEAYLSPP